MQFNTKRFLMIPATLCLFVVSQLAFAGAADSVALTAAFGIKAEIMAKLPLLPEVDVNLVAQPQLNIGLSNSFDQVDDISGLGANGISLGHIHLHDLYSGNPTSGLTATASSLVNNVSVGIAGLLSVTADAIGSTSTVNGSLLTAPLQAAGSVTLSNLKITILGIPLTIPANPAANTVINLGGLAALGVTGTITLNEQIQTAAGGDPTGLGVVNLTTSGLHVKLDINNALGVATVDTIIGGSSVQADMLSDEIFPDGFEP